MQDQEGHVADAGKETLTSVQTSEIEDWTKYKDDDIMQQQSSIQAEQAVKTQFVGDKEPLSSLEAEYHLGNSILLKKIKVLSEQYAALRRTRGDGNCFFRSFMFGYLELILESQDQSEVHRIKASIEECKKTLQSLGYAEFTFEDFFALFLEQLDSVLQGSEDSISHDELLRRSRDPSISDYVVMFFRFVTSGEIRKRSEFFEPFILGLTNASVEQFCKSSVEPMGEESDHVQIIALSDALGVPIRVVYLDRSSCENNSINVNHHDFVPTSDDMGNSGDPSITLLYRPGHYDILYPN
ncbi:OVARIAN TUMOR DOMAIN-containing deubiquitinating enzyme 1 [Nicotiana tabacum]|uniref:Ubiquitin thioesterase n=1 Tax=Nicotiana tabacum TaxID=4097 RepID=A0A1S4C2D4_TOBAC|nr:OVARIAN TUMOR DOMAIN-containing deubiquitinating enzyme 1 [Nicotiana tomentosiformis]XP_009607148.1 OVARIAN TUMOR DOMAIN-containing deubiquitinating enzyme 1 [Nicotiana tomentosiformis]XP_016495309.1 PREDICTED: ubiquitin thioesterase otubain-like [Nicotiana tabacum]XP_016495310.1 PREDICTED: ubiquitin thioesterase otubain-like [Nicotiana tabacum]XP_018628014.1 OVARIAN TUMOR DOMAIN-containing deubiquitinating enzyme 1 [Nicotiana tomentosiformis]